MIRPLNKASAARTAKICEAAAADLQIAADGLKTAAAHYRDIYRGTNSEECSKTEAMHAVWAVKSAVGLMKVVFRTKVIQSLIDEEFEQRAGWKRERV